jgi:hypothetical protein
MRELEFEFSEITDVMANLIGNKSKEHLTVTITKKLT